MSPDILGKMMALFSALSWSFAVIFFKRAGSVFSPLALTLYKSLVGFLCLLPFVIGLPLIPASAGWTGLMLVVASGLVGIAVSDSLLFLCLNHIGAGLTGIVECLYSPMVMLLSWMVLGEKLRLHHLGGAGLVVAAVAVVTWNSQFEHIPTRSLWIGIAAGTGAMLTLAAGIVLMKRVVDTTSVFWVSEVRLLTAIAVLFPLFMLKGNRASWGRMFRRRDNFKDALPGTILGNVLSLTLWTLAFKLTSVSSAAVLNQTNTVMIVVLASLWLKEPFTWRRGIATVLAMGGSVLVILGDRLWPLVG